MKPAASRLFQVAAAGLLAGLLLAALLLGFRTRSLGLRVDQLDTARRRMELRRQTLRQQVESLQVALSLPGERGAAPEHRTNSTRPEPPAADVLRRVASAEETLKTLRNSLSELQFHSQQIDFQVGRLQSEVSRLSSSETDLKHRLADAGRVVQAMETELQGKDVRLAPLELSTRSLGASRQAALDAIDRQFAPARSLEDLQRRREVYLGGVLGRYRDLAERSYLLATRPDAAGPELGGTLDVSRVQLLVSQAEEEFRQIQALDSQARLLLDQIQKQR